MIASCGLLTEMGRMTFETALSGECGPSRPTLRGGARVVSLSETRTRAARAIGGDMRSRSVAERRRRRRGRGRARQIGSACAREVKKNTRHASRMSNLAPCAFRYVCPHQQGLPARDWLARISGQTAVSDGHELLALTDWMPFSRTAPLTRRASATDLVVDSFDSVYRNRIGFREAPCRAAWCMTWKSAEK